MRYHTLTWLLIGTLGLAASALAQGGQQRLLPPFAVTNADRTEVRSEQLVVQGTWVMLCVRPDCPLCDIMLGATQDDPAPRPAGRLAVVVVGAEAEQLPALASRVPTLPLAAWHADPSMVAAQRLGLAGLPVIVGLRGSTIEWTLAGVLADRATITSVVRSWLAKSE
jgi:hypothetical protein